jgi:predicted Zn-dependent peptidase
MHTSVIDDVLYVIVDPVPRTKTTFEFIYTHGGSWYEEEADRGRSHLLEHIIVSRTKDMNFSQLKDLMFRESINYNAYTTSSSLAIEASGHKADFNKIFGLLFEMFTTPTFDQEGLDREKEIVLREIVDRQGNPQYKLYYDIAREVFTPDSFNPHEVLGNSAAVASTELHDLERLHQRMLQKSRLFLCISGGGADVEMIEHEAKLFLNSSEDHAGLIRNMSTKENIPLDYNNTFKTMNAEAICHPAGHEACELNMFIPVEVSFRNRPARELFANLFLRYGSKGLYDHLRDDLGLIYGYQYGYENNGSFLEFELNCEIKLVAKIIAETKLFFANFDKKFDSDKFEELKGQITKKQELSADKLGAAVEYASTTLLNYGTLETVTDFTNKLRAVTIEEIKELFEEVSTGLEKAKYLAVSKQEEIKNVFG